MTKFVSWNVNGLRACVGKGFEQAFNELNADFFCLQETKMQEGQLDLQFPGYQSFWNYAEKKGYSGTAIFCRQEPLSVRYGMGIETEQFFLVTVYTPNSQDGLKRLDYRMTWEDDFRNYLLKLDAEKPVIVCGDLNVAHREIDLKNPSTNRRNAGFTDEEREKMTTLLNAGFTDTFRFFYPDCLPFFSCHLNVPSGSLNKSFFHERQPGIHDDLFICHCLIPFCRKRAGRFPFRPGGLTELRSDFHASGTEI